MRNILLKECRLSASVLSYLFIVFGLMFLLPGYPVLCGAFFVCLGIFQSFQSAREANDIVYMALLPIAKKDVVKGKYLFSSFIQFSSLALMLLAVLLRMTLLKDSVAYRNNALMNANLFALGAAFLMFGLFNMIFIGGFFKTAYKFAKPFVVFIIAAFILIGIAETMHHIPGLERLNAFGFDDIGFQLILLCAGILCYLVLTQLSYIRACRDFELIDL